MTCGAGNDNPWGMPSVRHSREGGNPEVDAGHIEKLFKLKRRSDFSEKRYENTWPVLCLQQKIWVI